LDKKKFLFVSLDGLIADIAWQVVKEVHEVKLFIAHARRDRLGAGRVSCQADRQYVCRAIRSALQPKPEPPRDD